MHIQKTAGTSITEAVRPYYQNDIVSHGDYLKHDTANLKNIPFISGHSGFEYARQFMDDRYSFTFSLELGIPLSFLSTAWRMRWTLPGTFARASIGRTSTHTCGTSRRGNSRAAGMILSDEKFLISLRNRSWSGQRRM